MADIIYRIAFKIPMHTIYRDSYRCCRLRVTASGPDEAIEKGRMLIRGRLRATNISEHFVREETSMEQISGFDGPLDKILTFVGGSELRW